MKEFIENNTTKLQLNGLVRTPANNRYVAKSNNILKAQNVSVLKPRIIAGTKDKLGRIQWEENFDITHPDKQAVVLPNITITPEISRYNLQKAVDDWNANNPQGSSERPIRAKVVNNDFTIKQESRVIGMSGADPIGEFIVSNAVLGKPLQYLLDKGLKTVISKTSGEIVKNIGDRLKNTYYSKAPWTFKPNPNNYYRVGSGKEFIDDVFNSGKIRSVSDSQSKNLGKTFNQEDTYFAKGKLLNGYGAKNNYIIEADNSVPFLKYVNNRLREKMDQSKFDDLFFNDGHKIGSFVIPKQARVLNKELLETPGRNALIRSNNPLDYNPNQFKLYKPHWFKGYTEIPIPKINKMINNLTEHVQGNDAVKMFKQYGQESIPKNSGLGSRINRYVSEARERYGIENNTNITDDEIAGSLYKHMKQMQNQTGSSNINSAGEPRILFRADTQKYNTLKNRLTPKELEDVGGTMDNSLGTLFLGDYGRPIEGGGVERYLVGKTFNGGWNARDSGTGARYINETFHDVPHKQIWLDENALNNKSLRFRAGFSKAPSNATSSGVNEVNAYFINTNGVRDATKEISVLNDDFLAMQPSWKGGEVYLGDNPTRNQMAKHYTNLLNDSKLNNQGLLVSKKGSSFRDEHIGADYFALPNFNKQGAKHILPYDLRIPRNWKDPNVFKSVAAISSLSGLTNLNDNKWKKK